MSDKKRMIKKYIWLTLSLVPVFVALLGCLVSTLFVHIIPDMTSDTLTISLNIGAVAGIISFIAIVVFVLREL